MSFYKKQSNFITITVFITAIILTVSFFELHAKAKDEAAQANQVYIDYNYLASFINLYNGNTETAIKDYKKILPYLKTAYIYNEFTNMLLYSKQYDNAEVFLKKAIKLFPNNSKLYKKLLDVFIIKKEDEKAINFIKANPKIFHNSSNVYKKLAILYMRNSNYTKAIEYFKKIKSYKKNERILYYITECYKANGNIDNAIKYAKYLNKINNKNLSYKMILANLYEQAKNYKKAIEVYKSMNIAKDEKLSAIGNDYYLLGNIEKAFTYFKMAYKTKPNISYAEKAIYMLMRLGKYKNVINFIKKENIPLSTDRLKYFYGVSLMSEKDYRNAVVIFSKISPSSVLYKDTLYNEIVCYTKLKQKNKAIELLKSVKNKDEDIYYMLADLYLKYKNYKLAISTIAKNMNKFNNKAKAYFYIADIYYDKLKNKEKCILYLKKSLQINPKNPVALNYLGYLYIDENIDINKGIELVKKALKIDKNNPYYLDSLGWGYYKKREYTKALPLFIRAIEQTQKANIADDNVIKIHAIKTYIKINKKDKARKLLKEILKKSPKNDKARQLLNSLK